MMRRKPLLRAPFGQTMTLAVLAWVLLFNSQIAFSKVLFSEKTPIRLKACIELINHHPITSFHYPEFHLREELQNEVNDYCQCQYKKEQKLINKKFNGSEMSWLFRDPSSQLNQKDKCALEKLDKFSNETIYAIFYATQIAPFIQEHLKMRYNGTTRSIASEQSVEQKLNCLSQNLHKKCGRIKSLQVTYQCVNDHLRNSDYIDKMEMTCPQFSPDEVIVDLEEQTYL